MTSMIKRLLTVQVATVAGVVLVVVGLLAGLLWVLDGVAMSGSCLGMYNEVDLAVHRLGREIAEEALYLCRPVMIRSFREGVNHKAEQWGALEYRVGKIFDSSRPWADKESPMEILRIIRQEHAFGLFHKKNPERSMIGGFDAYEEARKDPDWVWVGEVQQKLHRLECLGSDALSATSRDQLRQIHEDVEDMRAEIEADLKKGPPSKNEKKRGISIPNPLINSET